MTDLPNLRDVQKRTIQLTVFQDGLWDLLMGAIMMLLAVYPVTRELLGPELNVAAFLIVMLALVGIQLVVRRYLSEPRIGIARSKRTPALKLALAVTVVLVASTFGVLILTLIGPGWFPNPGERSLMGGYAVEIVVMAACVGLFSLLGYLFGVLRLYLYGWLIGGSNLLFVFGERQYGWTFNLPLAVSAGAMLVIGGRLLQRFLQRYPIHQDLP